jgi:hypothetical protein
VPAPAPLLLLLLLLLPLLLLLLLLLLLPLLLLLLPLLLVLTVGGSLLLWLPPHATKNNAVMLMNAMRRCAADRRLEAERDCKTRYVCLARGCERCIRRLCDDCLR